MFWQKKKKCKCEVCGRMHPVEEMIAVRRIGPSLVPILAEQVPGYKPEGRICRIDLRKLRIHQLSQLSGEVQGASNLENVFFHDEELATVSFNAEYQGELTRGERLSQKVTPFIGSWAFVGLFVSTIVLWMGYNTQGEIKEHFDPFPFILLNLFLSCLAAIQAPIIMMAQNRLAKREQLRADEDYYTTLKAELEIRQLHEKIDKLLKK